jgi:hypothetical protein
MNYRNWSIVRKAAVIGALTGLLLSLGVLLIGIVTRPHTPFDLTFILWVLISALPTAILESLGLKTMLSNEANVAAWVPLGLIVLVNSLLFSAIGAVVGGLLNSRKR